MQVLDGLFPPEIARSFYIVAYLPEVRGDQDPRNAHKKLHVRRIAEHYGVANTDVLLFDDDTGNCTDTDAGVVACLVDKARGFRFSDLLKDGDGGPKYVFARPPLGE